MATTRIADTNEHLSKRIGDVEGGVADPIGVARNGKPAESAGKRLGLLKGRFSAMSLKDFNAADEAIAPLFTGCKRD